MINYYYRFFITDFDYEHKYIKKTVNLKQLNLRDKSVIGNKNRKTYKYNYSPYTQEDSITLRSIFHKWTR